MAETLEPAAAVDHAAEQQRVRPPWRRRLIAPAAVAVAALGVWWFVHPAALNDIGFGGQGLPAGQDFLVDAGMYPALEDGEPWPASYPVKVLALDVEQQGAAAVTFSVCTLVPDQGRIGSVYTSDEPGGLCAQLVPFEPGQTVDLATQQVLMRVSTEPGAEASIGPLTVTYVDGIRPGRQVLYGSVVVPTESESAP